ncbi:MAG: cytochrome P450 [Nitrospira sp.]|nr:cytochrome P450 [Nitrospira sp.]
MPDQKLSSLTLSGPPVSRWWGPFPELRRDTLGFFLRCQTYGDVVKLPMGLVIALLLRKRDAATYVLNHPADIKHVLVTNQDNYQKGMVPPVESRIFGLGVLHTERDLHHRQRRLFLPFFHGNHVTAYTDLITSQARDMVGGWEDGTTVDIEREMAHLTLSIIWRLLFGQEIGSESTHRTRSDCRRPGAHQDPVRLVVGEHNPSLGSNKGPPNIQPRSPCDGGHDPQKDRGEAHHI